MNDQATMKRLCDMLASIEVKCIDLHGSMLSAATAIEGFRESLSSEVTAMEAAIDMLGGIAEDEKQYKLGIVIGHTASRGGAVGVAPINANEHSWNTMMAKLFHDEFYGPRITNKVSVMVVTRDSIGVSGIEEAYARLGHWGADAVMELHFNSYTYSGASGTETLFSTELSAGFAFAVQEAMCSALGLGDRGLKRVNNGDRGFSSLNQLLTTPSIIIEPFFGSNPADCRTMYEKKKTFVSAVSLAILKYFETGNISND
jgi:N-acetylmuramoyl-L-alanine amidase